MFQSCTGHWAPVRSIWPDFAHACIWDQVTLAEWLRASGRTTLTALTWYLAPCNYQVLTGDGLQKRA